MCENLEHRENCFGLKDCERTALKTEGLREWLEVSFQYMGIVITRKM
jgi:hypothetical protein